jgi:hypothetical protein
MIPGSVIILVFLLHASDTGSALAGLPDIQAIPQDLHLPPLIDGTPAPGKRVRQKVAEFRASRVYHTLYLPTDWKPDQRYPVIVEYPGNGPYRSRFGDISTGEVEDCHLGYGISGGQGFIWLCLPFVSKDHQHNQNQWWGDIDATVNYCRQAVRDVCAQHGGDPSALILAGFSRGAIACSFIGLHDDTIAGMWSAFVLHSHYDGVRKWDYAGSDRASALKRLKRLHGRPQFISHEGSTNETRAYLEDACSDGRFTFQALPYRNHTDVWVLRDIPERRALRDWLKTVLQKRPPAESPKSMK